MFSDLVQINVDCLLISYVGRFVSLQCKKQSSSSRLLALKFR